MTDASSPHAVLEGRRRELARMCREMADTAVARLPLYRRIYEGLAGDDELLSLMDDTPDEQYRPLLLVAAVHDLLLSGVEHPLAAWYPTVTDHPRDAQTDDPVPAMRDFCLTHRAQLAPILAGRATQTNEVGRCAATMPAVAGVERETGGPVALVEVGASAGLNLLLDRWAYRYGDDGAVAPDGEPALTLTTRSRGPVTVPVPDRLPSVASRVGLDQAPLDVRDEDQARWLVACQWPEQGERIARVRAAIAEARRHPPDLVTGDAVDDLAPLLRAVPSSATPVVITTWVAAYLPEDRQRALLDVLTAVARERDLSYVFAEQPTEVPGLPIPPRPDGIDDAMPTVLVRLDWRDGRRSDVRLADMHPHGAWISWVAHVG